MGDNITGLHHITVIAGDPQENLDFYVGVVGMRLVKKTVNSSIPRTGEQGGAIHPMPWGTPSLVASTTSATVPQRRSHQ
jgi:catechol 2,3-dioxygenase-like lactoylglutathione lyase family enzyme